MDGHWSWGPRLREYSPVPETRCNLVYILGLLLPASSSGTAQRMTMQVWGVWAGAVHVIVYDKPCVASAAVPVQGTLL